MLVGATTTATATTTSTRPMVDRNLLSTTPPFNTRLAAKKPKNMKPAPRTHDMSSNPPLETNASTGSFVPEDCLFCDETFSSPAFSHEHMETRHGLHIPKKQKLITDLDTLFCYLHLVIFQYHECIHCHTKRNSPRAVQQHMVSKRHCKIDIDAETSEFRDFYDLTEAESQSEDCQSDSDDPDSLPVRIVDGDKTLRLPSGKTLLTRKTGVPGSLRPRRSRRTLPPKSLDDSVSDEESTESSVSHEPAGLQSPSSLEVAALPSSSPPVLTAKQAKREKYVTKQLASLRESDRQALAHLPFSEQRALLATAQKDSARAGRAAERFRGKMDGFGNIKMTEHFIIDVPFGNRHKCRFPV